MMDEGYMKMIIDASFRKQMLFGITERVGILWQSRQKDFVNIVGKNIQEQE